MATGPIPQQFPFSCGLVVAVEFLQSGEIWPPSPHFEHFREFLQSCLKCPISPHLKQWSVLGEADQERLRVLPGEGERARGEKLVAVVEDCC